MNIFGIFEFLVSRGNLSILAGGSRIPSTRKRGGVQWEPKKLQITGSLIMPGESSGVEIHTIGSLIFSHVLIDFLSRGLCSRTEIPPPVRNDDDDTTANQNRDRAQSPNNLQLRTETLFLFRRTLLPIVILNDNKYWTAQRRSNYGFFFFTWESLVSKNSYLVRVTSCVLKGRNYYYRVNIRNTLDS